MGEQANKYFMARRPLAVLDDHGFIHIINRVLQHPVTTEE